MKSFIKKSFLLFLSLTMVVAFASFGACSKPNNSGWYEDFEVADFSLNYSSLSLSLYDEVQLSVKNFDGIEWSSSSTDVLSVDANGKVVAVGYGEAKIIASKGDKRAECSVLVIEEGLIPQIKIDGILNKEIPLSLNAERIIDYSILFNGKTFSDGAFTFTSSNEEVVAVDANGKLKAKAYGKAVIDISANWRSITNHISLKEQITINVNHDLAMEFNAEQNAIYTVAQALDGKQYVNTTNLTYTIKVAGVDVTNSVSTRFEYDQTMINITDDCVSPLQRGQAEITLVCEYDGVEYISNPLVLEVKAPVIDFTTETLYFSILGQEDLTLDGVDGVTNKVVVNGNNVFSNVDCSVAGKVSIDKDVLLDLRREKEIVVSTDLYDFKYATYFATHVIKTAEEFTSLIALIEDSASVNGSNGWHVVLANDIDLQGRVYHKEGNDYFGGVFDGNGHAISNLEILGTQYEVGLFGYLSGILENVAFINVSSSGANAFLLSHYMLGTTRNVYVSGIISGSGVAVRQGWSSSSGAFGRIENCIINVNYINPTDTVVFLGQNENSVSVSSSVVNSFAIGNAEKFVKLATDTRSVYDTTQEFLNVNADEIDQTKGWSKFWQVSDKTLLFGGKTVLVGDADVFNDEITAEQSKKFDLTSISSNVVKAYVGGVEIEMNADKEVDLSKYLAGNTIEIIINDGEKLISQPVFVVSHLIDTAQELLDFFALDNESDYAWTATKEKTVYVLLTADIDCAGQIVDAKYMQNVFNGVFDGAGHTIKDLTIRCNNKQDSTGQWNILGLFGNVTTSSVIKNVAFVNLTSLGNNGDLISGYMTGTIQNVFVSGKLYGGQYGRVVSLQWSNERAGFGIIKNSIFNVEYTSPVEFFQFDSTDIERDTLENVLVVSNATAYSNFTEENRTVYKTSSALITSEGAKMTVANGWSDLWDVTSKFITFNGTYVLVGEVDVVKSQIYYKNDLPFDLTTICTNPKVAFINGVQVDINDGKISLADCEKGKVAIVTVSNGTQTVSQPILVATHIIENATQLKEFFNYSGNANTNGTSSWYAVLTSDIDLKNETLNQKTSSDYFAGTFAGLGHSISNVVLTSSDGYHDKGVFGYILSSGVIKDVAFVNISSVKGDIITSYMSGKMSNVYVKGILDVDSTSYHIADIGWANNGYGKLENCIFEVQYTGTVVDYVTKYDSTSNKNITVKDCYGIGNAVGFSNNTNDKTVNYQNVATFIANSGVDFSANGWSKYWVKTNDGLYFGQTKIG